MSGPKTTVERYAICGEIARVAMGPSRSTHPFKLPNGKLEAAADEDPLAWWLLTELIFNGGRARPERRYAESNG